MSLSLNGKSAIVTGAANGVGLAIARHFVDCGARVMFADRDEARLHDEVGDEAADEATPIRMFAGDLTQKLTIANLLSATIDAFEGVDILVNASRAMAVSDPMSPDGDAVEEMLAQNLMTALRLTQHTAKKMIALAERQGRTEGLIGSVVNISSIAARRTRPDLLGYSVATAAVDQMTRSMAVALAPQRIRVNAVAFGSVMSASLRDRIKGDDALRDDIVAHTPLGRIAPPSELAEVAQFLASDAARFITGQIVSVDGGRSLIDPSTTSAH
jgi:7-alpha-hydroxysteroid dehydrogenase